MASALANFLRAQMELKGWNQTDLAAACDLPKTTVSDIFTKPHKVPELPTFVKLSRGLAVSLRVLLQVAGFEVEAAGTVNEEQERIAALVSSMPWLGLAVDDLVTLHPDDRAGFLAYIEAVKRQRGHA